MKLLDLVSRKRICPHLRARDKEEALAELVDAMVADGTLQAGNRAVEVLLDRERLGSTGIGDGVAIPHGKLAQIEQPLAVVGRSEGGVDFDSMDGAPVHLFFLLLAPEDAPSAQLRALARISRLLKDQGVRQQLFQARTGDEIYALIEHEDERI